MSEGPHPGCQLPSGSAWWPVNSANIHMQKKKKKRKEKGLPSIPHTVFYIFYFYIKITPQSILGSNVKPQVLKLEPMGN